MNLQLSQPNADVFIPDKTEPVTALRRTTHLGVGAHQDDLEFMALEGILACYQRDDLWFGGITCTDGVGSARGGPYASYTDVQMAEVRLREQQKAARIGQYAFVAQLGHPSSHAKDPSLRDVLVEDLLSLLSESAPTVVYTHNPFDRHPSHRGVLSAVIEAIRRLPASRQPDMVLGCEVWRGLDWLPDSHKIVQDVSAHRDLAAALNGVFASQICAGKRYDSAVEGRRLANATFLESHAVDQATRVSFAIDLTPLMTEPGYRMEAFVGEVLEAFCGEIRLGCGVEGEG